jgi:fimbrial chaperone protein
MKSLLSIATSLAMAAPAFASSFVVSPTTIILDPAQKVATITVENRDTSPVKVQLSAFAWSQADGQDNRTAPTADIRFAPPVVEILPGKKQVLRVFRPHASQTAPEAAYRITVRELPAPSVPGAPKKAMVLLQEHNIPLFFRAKSAAPQVSMSWQGNSLVVRNAGTATAKIENVGPAGGKPWQSLVGYVLPGSVQTFKMPARASSLSVRVNGADQSMTAN